MVFISVPLKKKHEDEETSRIINVVGFSAIFLLSLTGAGGLTIRATSGSNFCEEFSSGGSGRCGEARLAVAMSWTSVVIGGLTYLQQSMMREFLIGSFSHRWGPGLLVG